MRRILSIALCVLSGIFARGEVFPESFLAKVKDSRVVINYVFDAEKGSKSYGGSGVITTQDLAYKLETDGIAVYDDLESNWTVNSSSKEVSIDDSNASDFFEKPASILSLLGLNPKKAKVSVRMVNEKSFELDATLSDGMRISVRAVVDQLLPKASLSDFAYDTSVLGKDWMVTDLR